MVSQVLFMQESGDSNAVSINDVNQGWLGDCYICAPIASLAMERPDYIRDMIRDNGNGTQSVRLFLGTNWNAPGTTHYHDGVAMAAIPVASDGSAWITVKDTDLGPGMNTNNGGQLIVNGVQEIWPQVIENAFAQVNGGYQTIGMGGDCLPIMNQLTGNTGSIFLLGGFFSNSISPSTNMLQSYLNNHDLVCFETYSPTGYGLVYNHAYTLTGVDTVNGVDYAHFRNPWGYGDPQPIPVSELINQFSIMETEHVPLLSSTPVPPAAPIIPVANAGSSLDFTDMNFHHIQMGTALATQTFTRDQTGLDQTITQSIGSNGVVTISTPVWNDIKTIIIQDTQGTSFATNAFLEVNATLSGATSGSLLLTNAQHANISLDHGNYTVTVNAHSAGADRVVNGQVQHTNDFVVSAGAGNDTVILHGDGIKTHGVFQSGSGHDVFFGAMGGNSFDFGAGRAEVTGGTGVDNYVYHASSGVDVIQNFDRAMDTISLDASLKGMMKQSHGTEGTTLMFGSAAHELVLHAIQNFDAAQIHWV